MNPDRAGIRPVGLMTLLVSLAIFSAGTPVFAQSAGGFPRLPVRTLAGKELTLPDGIAQQNAILVIGFTQASEKQTVVWRKRLSAVYSTDALTVVYPVIVIQNIPGIFHGLLLAGIRAGVPKSEWSHFLVVSAEEAKWKPAIAWEGPDRAYVVLLDRAGRIAWRRSGPFDEKGFASLTAKVKGIEGTERGPLTDR